MFVQLNLTVPPEMLQWIDEERDEGQSREEFIRECIREETIYKQTRENNSPRSEQ